MREGSEGLPPYYPDAQCDRLCAAGEYMKMSLYPQIKQVCTICPPNTISTDGGFQVDAKMDDAAHLSFAVAQHFDIKCYSAYFNSEGQR